MSRTKMLAFIFLLTLPLGLLSLQARSLATCSGPSCNGLNPHTTGCDEVASTWEAISIANGRVELRFSWICDTLWARTRNLSGWHYAQSTLAYYAFWEGYNYAWYYTNSPAKIGPGSSVYTRMRYDPVPDPYWNACGRLTSFYIGYPVLSPCTPRQ